MNCICYLCFDTTQFVCLEMVASIYLLSIFMQIFFSFATIATKDGLSDESIFKQQHESMSDWSTVVNWSNLYMRLFTSQHIANVLSSYEVELILQDMLRLEQSEALTKAKVELGANVETTLGSYDRLERDLKGQKLLLNANDGLTKTLLSTFNIKSNNCLEHNLERLANIIKKLQSTMMHNILETNLRELRKHCWQKYMSSLESLSSWLAPEELQNLDELQEKMNFADDKFSQSTSSESSPTFSIDEKILASSIGTFLRDKAIAKHDISSNSKPIDFLEEFKSEVVNPCKDLYHQTSSMIKRVLTWLNSIKNYTSKQSEVVSLDNYKFINRFHMCTIIRNSKEIPNLVLKKLNERDFWNGFEESKLYKSLHNTLKETRPTIRANKPNVLDLYREASLQERYNSRRMAKAKESKKRADNLVKILSQLPTNENTPESHGQFEQLLGTASTAFTEPRADKIDLNLQLSTPEKQTSTISPHHQQQQPPQINLITTTQLDPFESDLKRYKTTKKRTDRQKNISKPEKLTPIRLIALESSPGTSTTSAHEPKTNQSIAASCNTNDEGPCVTNEARTFAIEEEGKEDHTNQQQQQQVAQNPAMQNFFENMQQWLSQTNKPDNQSIINDVMAQYNSSAEEQRRRLLEMDNLQRQIREKRRFEIGSSSSVDNNDKSREKSPHNMQ